jgi:cytidylate kinase
MSINIAIDGPAGAGKSTIAKKLAGELGYIYVDTGAMYRAMALYVLEHDIDLEDEAAVAAACPDINIRIAFEEGTQCVYLNGENVNGRIRTEQISGMASKVSAQSAVRAHLLELQRSLARSTDVIMDGRDIGTHVLPDAQVKIFLTASVKVRAERRYKEYLEKGQAAVLEEIEKEIQERDERDMNREIAPLKQADDAVLVDTSNMDISQVVACIRQIILEKTGQQ